MSRITNAVLDQKAFGRGSSQVMLDPSFGGQMGYAPNLKEWISNQAYVRRNLIPILIEAPRFFQLMPDPGKWVETLKSLIELHPKSIEGYNSTLTVETDEHNVGGAGEMQQEVTDVKRTRSEPSFTWVEKYGMPITTFLQQWITYGLMDPDTKFALVGTLANGGNKPEDMLADWYSATVLMIEPDPTHMRVVKAYLSTNMFPKTTGTIEAKRDLTTASEILNLTVDFTAITQQGLGVNKFAQTILDQLNRTNANPYLRPAFVDSISSDVKAAAEGYEKSIKDLGSSAVPGLR